MAIRLLAIADRERIERSARMRLATLLLTSARTARISNCPAGIQAYGLSRSATRSAIGKSDPLDLTGGDQPPFFWDSFRSEK